MNQLIGLPKVIQGSIDRSKVYTAGIAHRGANIDTCQERRKVKRIRERMISLVGVGVGVSVSVSPFYCSPGLQHTHIKYWHSSFLGI
ncbi:hypothetical protein EAF00_007631 [Botryotinia globosa]|nr:hypothetical protein EAF00_007631 [Botryotinia globosa]